MKSTTKSSLALYISLFTSTYSSIILTIALWSFMRDGAPILFFRGSEVITHMVGDLIGPLLILLLSAHFNRKRTALIALGVSAVAGILTVSAMSSIQAVVASFFVGLSQAMMFTVAILWASENADTNNRGRKVVLLFVAVSVGRAVAEWVGFAIVSGPSSIAVRLVAGVQIALVAATATLLHFSGIDSYRYCREPI
jgi:MFS family permease